MSFEGMIFPFTEMRKYILSKAAPLKLTELWKGALINKCKTKENKRACIKCPFC